MEILSLGEKIKRKRKELDMTLKDLAGDRITPGQISLVESGRSNPSMDLLEYLASRLNITIEYLMESAESQANKQCIYFENIAESAILGQNYKKAEEYINKAIEYSKNYNLQYREAKNLYLKGNIAENLGHLVEAQEIYLDCNTIFLNKEKYEEAIKSFLRLGDIAINLESFYSANSYLRQAEKVYLEKELSDDLLLGEVYFKMAECYYNMDQIEKAKEYSVLATEKFNGVYNKKKYAEALMNKAEYYKELGNLNDAIYYSKAALKKYKEFDLEVSISEIENRLGVLFSEFNKYDEAFNHYRIAKSLRHRNRESKIIETLINISESYMNIKDLHSCETVLIEASAYLEGASVEAMVNYKMLLYRVYMTKELFLEAEGVLIEAFELSENNMLSKKAADIAMIISKFYIDFKRDIEAAKYLNKGIKKLKNIGVLRN